MLLGVDTHFAQGWNTGLIGLAASYGITDIRDEQYWSQIETKSGTYTFPLSLTGYMAAAQNAHVNPLIDLDFANVLHDKGLSPYTDEGRKAFADYCVAVLDQYHGQIKA